MPSAITDPLSGSARARTRLRLAGAGLLGAGAVTIVATLAAPDPDPSDRRGLLICAAVFALVALGGMLHSADLALYAAKRTGRDRVVRADALQPPDVAATIVAPVAGA